METDEIYKNIIEGIKSFKDKLESKETLITFQNGSIMGLEDKITRMKLAHKSELKKVTQRSKKYKDLFNTVMMGTQDEHPKVCEFIVKELKIIEKE